MQIGNKRLYYKPNNEYYTPKWLFDAFNVTFDLDVCSPIDRTTFVPARKRYTLLDDGLESPWSGFVWMNPPYSKPSPWIEKFIEHGNGIALIPFSRSRWFVDLWDKTDAIMALPSNFKFVKPDGKHASVFMPVALASIGDLGNEAIKNLQMNRVR